MLWSKFVTALAMVPSVLAKPIAMSEVFARSQLERRTAGSASYSISSGDTGGTIAAVYSITFSTLSQANPNVNWNSLQIGQQIVMPSSRSPSTYTVTSGDTQSSIAQKYNVYSDDLANANPSVSWSNLQAGTKLRVPGYGAYTSYSVASGDYGYAISSAFGISFDSLSSANPGVNWNSLQVGQVLTVPAGVSPTKNSLPSPASPPSQSTTALKTTTASSVMTTSSTTYRNGLGTPPTQSSSTSSSLTSAGNGLGLPPKSTSTSSSSTSAYLSTTTSTKNGLGVPSRSSSTTSSSTTKIISTTLSTITSTKITTTSVQTTSSTRSTSSTSSTSTTRTTPTTTTTASSIGTGVPTVTPTATVTGANYVSGYNNNDGVASHKDAYNFYQGDGSTAAGWPSKSQWLSFSTMWNNFSPYLGQACSSIYGVANNSPQENQYIYNAIQTIAANSGVDHRLILASIIQESSACVRVRTTVSPDGTVVNPGLMQTYNGSGSCNKDGVIQNPCPAGQIYQMISDGVFGTSRDGGKTYSVGLVQDINASPAYSDAQVIYRATRIYNSGSVPSSNDLGAPGATRCYASDMANLLMGWVGAKKTCTLDN